MSNPNITALSKLKERMEAGLPETGHDHTRKLSGTVALLALGLDSIDTMHRTPSPTETAGAHQKKIMQAAAKLSTKTAEVFERMQEITRDGLREIEARMNKKLNLFPDGYAAEIRAQFRTMPTKDQYKLLGELVDANRGPELAALLKAPAILTGLNAEVQTRYTQALEAKHAPEELRERDLLTEAFSTALLCIDTATKAAQSYSDPAKLAAIEAGEQSAADAAAAFARATI